ncbi:MAG TPA: hypothetical protein VKF62_13070, partial [Planctomycetota bacterium]|nr:hypothetical protein [Planctomycetota bacterium]
MNQSLLSAALTSLLWGACALRGSAGQDRTAPPEPPIGPRAFNRSPSEELAFRAGARPIAARSIDREAYGLTAADGELWGGGPSYKV